MARQATFFAILAAVAVGAWTMSSGATPEFGGYFVPAGLRDVAVHEPTLETVFIQLTGRELRD